MVVSPNNKMSLITAFRKACREGEVFQAKTMMNARNPDGSFVINLRALKHTPMQWALDGDHEAIITNLLLEAQNEDGSYRVDPAAYNNWAIREACRWGCTDMVRLLLDAHNDDGTWRVDPAANNNEAIRNACYYGHADVVQLLVDARHLDGSMRVDPAVDDNRQFQWACFFGYTSIVKTLLDVRVPVLAMGEWTWGVDPAANNSDALQVACQCGHTSTVQLLLDARNNDGSLRMDVAVNENLALKMAHKYSRDAIIPMLLNTMEHEPEYPVA